MSIRLGPIRLLSKTGIETIKRIPRTVQSTTAIVPAAVPGLENESRQTDRSQLSDIRLACGLKCSVNQAGPDPAALQNRNRNDQGEPENGPINDGDRPAAVPVLENESRQTDRSQLSDINLACGLKCGVNQAGPYPAALQNRNQNDQGEPENGPINDGDRTCCRTWTRKRESTNGPFSAQ